MGHPAQQQKGTGAAGLRAQWRMTHKQARTRACHSVEHNVQAAGLHRAPKRIIQLVRVAGSPLEACRAQLGRCRAPCGGRASAQRRVGVGVASLLPQCARPAPHIHLRAAEAACSRAQQNTCRSWCWNGPLQQGSAPALAGWALRPAQQQQHAGGSAHRTDPFPSTCCSALYHPRMSWHGPAGCRAAVREPSHMCARSPAVQLSCVRFLPAQRSAQTREWPRCHTEQTPPSHCTWRAH